MCCPNAVKSKKIRVRTGARDKNKRGLHRDKNERGLHRTAAPTCTHVCGMGLAHAELDRGMGLAHAELDVSRRSEVLLPVCILHTLASSSAETRRRLIEHRRLDYREYHQEDEGIFGL